MLDMHLKPEKYLTAEDVGCLVGRGERLVQQMYRAHLIDAAELRRGKVMFSPSEARRWKTGTGNTGLTMRNIYVLRRRFSPDSLPLELR